MNKKTPKLKDIKQTFKGLTFAEAAQKIEKKYPNRETSSQERNGYNYEMELLSKLNDEYREKQQLKNMLSGKQLQNQDMATNQTNPVQQPIPETNSQLNTQEEPQLQLGGLIKDFMDSFGSKDKQYFIDLAKERGFEDLKDSFIDRDDEYNLGVLKNNQKIKSFILNATDAQLAEMDKFYDEDNVAKMDSVINAVVDKYPVPDLPIKQLGGTTVGISALNNVANTLQQQTNNNFGDKLKGILKNPYTPSIVGTGINLIGNAFTAFQEPEEEMPEYNQRTNTALQRLEKRGTSFDDVRDKVQQGYNTARKGLGNTRSAGLRRALESNLSDSYLGQLSSLGMEQQRYQDQLNSSLASTELQVGQQEANERKRVNELNSRNRSNAQNERSRFTANLAENAKFFTKMSLNKKMNDMYGKIISQKYTDFGIPQDLYQKVISGEPLSNIELLTLKNSKDSNIYDFAQFYNNQ